MTKHGRNCTNSSVYTYHERKKDAQASGFGTDRMRASKDSVKDFDCCCLTLQPCRNPVITPDGYLYDKEAILEYILTKKKEFRDKMKQYEKERKKEEMELQELAMVDMRTKQSRFERLESSIISKDKNSGGLAGSSSLSSNQVSNVHGSRALQLPSFWIPSLTPSASASRVQPPSSVVTCPMSGRRLRINQLQPVQFTAAAADLHEEQLSLVARRTRYKCCVTGDVLGNSVPCAVLKPTGHVVSVDCLDRLVRKDMLHPITGEKLTERDIILMHIGGTGFAVTNNQLTLSGARPVMQA